MRFRSTWLALALVGAAACSNNRPNTSDTGNTSSGSKVGSSACDTPTLGCPCSSPGIAVSCGNVDRISGDYVSCSRGLETCQASGSWGACIGDANAVSTQVYAPTGGLRLSSLATTSATCVNNPCDPSCMSYTDAPNNLDAGTGLAADDSGVGITGTLVTPANSTCTGLSPMANQSVVVTSLSPIATTPSTTSFTTSLIPASCYTGTVTPLWGVDRFDLAVISTSGAYSQVVPTPAVVTVTGYAGYYSTSATVTVTVNVTDLTTGPAPTGYTAAKFYPTTTPTSSEALPKILYPYDSTVFPLGLTAPLLMWQRATTASAAKAAMVTLSFTGFSWSAVIPEGSQRFQIPQSAWTAFAQAATGSTGQLTLQRIDSTGKLQQGVSINLKFAPANLRGRIYYAQYASGNGGIESVLPYGSAAPVAQYSLSTPGGTCGVCHTMSADGKKFISSSDNAGYTVGQSQYGMSNVNTDGTFTQLGPGPSGGGDSRGLAYAAVTRTGTYALLGNNWWGNVNGGSFATPGSAGPNFKVISLPAAAGPYTDVSALGAGGSAAVWGLNGVQMYVPTFSPDNTRLAFVDADTKGGNAGRQGISTFNFSESGKSFSARTTIVNTTASPTVAAIANKFIRWPTFENDSRSLIFQTAATSDDDGFDWYAGMNPSGCCGRVKVHGQLWSIDAGPVGGSHNNPVALTLLNNGLGASSPLGTDDTNRSYQPTELGIAVGGYRWAVFTSVRSYGNFVNNGTGALSTLKNKLWVGAIDDAVSGTVDRSHPPFLLPNQDLSTNTLNERGYWALDACKAPDIAASTCSGNDECCGYNPANVSASTALCQVDQPLASPPTFHCKGTSSAVCKTLGSSCSQNSDCCGFPPSPLCVSGTCQQLPPVVEYLSPATYARDYTATCATGKSVVWRFFDWQTQFPTGTGSSIVFKAATAKTQTLLGAATQVNLATQTVTNTTWTGSDVSAALTSSSQVSQAWLRVYMTFNPTTDKFGTPTLTAWRQSYDCVDSQ